MHSRPHISPDAAATLLRGVPSCVRERARGALVYFGLAERTRQAGSAAFKMGQFDQAVALYTEALQACAGGELWLAGCEIAAR